MTKLTSNGCYLKVRNLVGTVAFLCDFLEMEIVQEQYHQGLCTLAEKNNGAQVFLSDKTSQKISNNIQFRTTDCIEQYCLLKSRGVIFTQEPTYTSEGLIAAFTDPYENHYVLLEARKYND